MKKPHLIRYGKREVTSFDALGQVIPELTGPYTDELRERVEEAKTPDTELVDVD